MDIIGKAKELGEMIKHSKEMQDLKRSEEKMMQDDKAKTILNDMYALQDEMHQALHGESDEASIEDIKARYISKQNEMKGYDITKNYLEDKTKFDAMMQQVNDVIVYSITGEEPCSSSGCSSCGGGCHG